MADVVEKVPEQQIVENQESAEAPAEMPELTFDEKVQMLQKLETQMNESKAERDNYVSELDAEVEKTIEKMELKKMIKENADHFTIDIIKQIGKHNPGTQPLEVLKSLLIIVKGEKKEYRWFKAQMMLEKEEEFLKMFKEFDLEKGLEDWQIEKYMEQMQIDFYKLEGLKNYGINWKCFFIWAESVIAYNLVKIKDPNCQKFTSKLEDCKMSEMIKHLYTLESNGFKKYEYEFLKLYHEMHVAHADQMNSVTLQDQTKTRYAEKLEQETLRAYVIELLQDSRKYVKTMETQQNSLSNILSMQTKLLQKRIDSDLPQQISRVERNMKADQDYIVTMQEKNDALLKNHTENDDDFIEYELDPQTKFTVIDESQDKYEFTKNNTTHMATYGFKEFEPMNFKIKLKKPMVIGAMKLGLTHTVHEDKAPKREEGDDAYLEISVKLKWEVGLETNDIATLKFDKYEAQHTSTDDLDKLQKLVRCKDDQSYCGQELQFTAEIKGEKGKDYFKNFDLSMVKLYM